MMSEAGLDHRDSDLFGESDTQSRVWLSRLRSDFRLAIVSLFGICTVLVILPFAVFRFLAGDILIALADGVVIAAIAAVVGYAWWTGRSLIAGRLVATITTASFLVMLNFLGVSVVWAFPLMLANFLLADRYFAATVSAIALVTMAVQPSLFPSPIEAWSFMACAVLVSFFGLIFASHTEAQRRKLADIAAQDPLTLAGNRRALRSHLDALLDKYRQSGRPVALALLDLDHFKRVNDTHGHEAGDQVLVALVRIVKSTVRQADRIYRIGGEEFVLVLPDTGLDGLRPALEKLQAAFASQLKGPDGRVTVSMGAATLEPDDDIRGLIGRADAALYRAKHEGRNRIVVVESNADIPDAAQSGIEGTSDWR